MVVLATVVILVLVAILVVVVVAIIWRDLWTSAAIFNPQESSGVILNHPDASGPYCGHLKLP